MRTWTERYEEAHRHVVEGQRIIHRQLTLIERQKVLGRDTTNSEVLLAAFRNSQAIFESDLARIRQERGLPQIG
jgi:hypothetical protein